MQEQSTLPVGTVIREQYVVEDLLGKSNSGATYLVRDQHARDAPGGLFVLKEVVESNKQARLRLASEGKLLRQLHHQGFPRVHRVLNNDKNNRVYLLADYIAGQDLETLRQQQPEKLFSWSKAMSIMYPVIAAVTYLHGQRPPIIHGDIKPANIIMPEDGSGVVLVGIGVMKARDPGSTTAAHQYCNWAPEQYNGGIDVQTDVYALGATFYTLVTGKLPPDAPSRLAQVGDEAMDTLEPANDVAPAIPMHIGRAIDQAMSLDTQRRFSSVEQFWQVLWYPVEHSPPVFGIPSVPNGLPAVTAPGPERVFGQATEKLVPGSLEAGSVLDSLEEREDPDATIRLPKLPPGVSVPGSLEEWEDLNVEKPPPVAPADVEEREDQDVEKPLPWPSGNVRAPISLRKLGMLFIVLALLIGLGIGASFLSRARSHPAAHSAIPPSHAASPASTPTSALVASSYAILAGTYSGTMYDMSVNASTSMSLTVTQQNQGSFSGYFRLGPPTKGSDPFRGTIDTTKNLQFTVADAAGNATLFFEGAMQSATSLSGDYYKCNPGPIQGARCSRAPGGYGIWNVIRALSGDSSSKSQSSIAEVASFMADDKDHPFSLR